MVETTKPDERGWELTRLVFRTLALAQIALVIGGLLAPITRTAGEDEDPLSVPGLFGALSNVAEAGELAEERSFFLVVAAVAVLALIGTGIVALLLVGGQWYPGRLPLLQYLLAAVLVLSTVGLFLAARWLSIEEPGLNRFTITTDHVAGGPAWGLWVLIAAAAWAVNLGYGVKRLAK